MLSTLRTLWLGEVAREDEALRARRAVDLIDQALREAEGSLRAAQGTLATLIQRERAEARLLGAVESRLSGLEDGVRAAIRAGDDAAARTGAGAIAELRAERDGRRATLARLSDRAARLRASVKRAQRRLVELRHGALQARAVRREHDAQRRLGAAAPSDPAGEADALIRQVLEEDDPLERSEILREIEAGPTGRAEARLRAAGHMKGAPDADAIIAELSAELET